MVFLSVSEFLALPGRFPVLYPVIFLLLAVVLVNGWTDAPNAIATAVSSGALGFRAAVFLSAGCNFLGVWLACLLFPLVADTIYSIADFGKSPSAALAALSAAMLAIVLWAVLAWRFGIPTSESHALVSAVTGAAWALQGSLAAVRWEAWGKVLFGLVFSVLAGFLLGGWLAKGLPRQKRWRGLQIAGTAATSFLHGAQDGQKFAGIFLLAVSLAEGKGGEVFPSPPLWLVFLVSAVMALGTLMGGRKIIDKVCREMARLSPREAFAADLGAGAALAAATLWGLPVSTTHAKTAAVLGAGMASAQPVGRRAAWEIGLAWVFTFPACLALGYLAAKLSLG